MNKINILIGRFQPITNGHVKCMAEAKQKLGLPTVICMIDTLEEKVDKRHPFPSSMLLPMYQKLFKKNNFVKGIILVKNANIVAINEEVKKQKLGDIASWTCGTDRIESYEKMSKNYKNQAELTDDFQMLEIKRTDEDESATKVREAIYNDDYKSFCAMTPFGSLRNRLVNDKSDYNTLREQLLKVY